MLFFENLAVRLTPVYLSPALLNAQYASRRKATKKSLSSPTQLLSGFCGNPGDEGTSIHSPTSMLWQHHIGWYACITQRSYQRPSGVTRFASLQTWLQAPCCKCRAYGTRFLNGSPAHSTAFPCHQGMSRALRQLGLSSKCQGPLSSVGIRYCCGPPFALATSVCSTEAHGFSTKY